MGCTLFWEKFGKAFAYFVVSCLLARWCYYYNKNFYFDCKIRLRKYISAKESFYLQGIPNDINEQDTSFLDCKH